LFKPAIGAEIAFDTEWEERDPDAPDFRAASGGMQFKVQTKKQAAIRRTGIRVTAEALASLKQGQKDRLLAEAGPKIKAALEAGDYVAAGSMLREVKEAAGHGGLLPWLKCNGINERVARRHIAAFKKAA
jgi:hypothetical protein